MGEFLASTSLLGLVVMLGVIGIPVYTLVFTTMFGGPKVGNIRGVFIGTVVLLIVGFVVFTWIGGAILSMVVPK